ncbi:hypothetical protein GIB67_030084, partial [Kingdonia uniflora]
TSLSMSVYLQVLSYDQLMKELDISNVRELEDFLINECIYLVQVQFAIGRDLRPGQLGSASFHEKFSFRVFRGFLVLASSDNLLLSIQEKIKWVDTMSELHSKHQKNIDDMREEKKKNLPLKVS